MGPQALAKSEEHWTQNPETCFTQISQELATWTACTQFRSHSLSFQVALSSSWSPHRSSPTSQAGLQFQLVFHPSCLRGGTIWGQGYRPCSQATCFESQVCPCPSWTDNLTFLDLNAKSVSNIVARAVL